MSQLLGLPIATDYRPSDGELDNLVYLTLKYTVGWGMRACDLAVCIMMAGGKDAIVGDEGISKLVWEACQYTWDHIAGEPEEFSPEQLFEHIKPAILNWYQSTTVEDRAKTE